VEWNGETLHTLRGTLTPPKAEVSPVHHQSQNPIESIPPPGMIRVRLAQALHEVQLLRDLLKVSERKERCARPEAQRKGGGRAT
jgi:hypothetical protein